MPSSIREQAIAAAIVLLNTDRPTGIPEFKRDRLNPFQGGTLAAGNVRMAPIAQPQETVAPATNRQGHTVVRTLRIGVEHYAAGTSSEVLDAQLAWAVAQLAGSRLGGVAHWVEEEATIWDEAALDADYRKAVQIFAIQYQTKTADLTSTA